jgi:hypothetical protein
MMLGAVAAIATLTASLGVIDTAQAAGSVDVSGGSLYLNDGADAGVAPCLLYRLTFAASLPADSHVEVSSSATGHVAQISHARTEPYSATPYIGGDYCIPLGSFGDTDTLVFTLVSRDGSTKLAVSDPVQLDMTQASYADVNVLVAELAKVVSTGVVDRQEFCLELGESFPTHVTSPDVPDLTFACDAAVADTAMTRDYAPIRTLLATTGAASVATLLYEIWLKHWLGGCTGRCPAPTPAPIVDPTPTPPAPDPAVLERQLIIERIQTTQTKHPLDDATAGAAADACMATERVTIQSPGYTGSGAPCLSYALYFPGANAGAAAIHDRDVILAAAPQLDLALLTYMSKKDKLETGLARDWYNNEKRYPAYANVCHPGRKARGVHCDEYPYYTTVQGGPPNADLREVAVTYNTSEGASRKLMYNDPDCVMAVNSVGVRTQPGSKITPFLVIPLATQTTSVVKKKTVTTYSGPRTFYVCGNTRSISVGTGDGPAVSAS